MLAAARPLVLALSGSLLMSIAPVPEQFSEHLLDPLASIAGLCSGERGAGSMRAMLAASAAAVGTADPDALPVYDGLGPVHMPITSARPLAQRYFDQGLGFAYGFNHAAALAAFRQAQALDPGCAMCFWGEAFAHGPNINAAMETNANAAAITAAQRASALSASATPVEKALIGAMLRRYSADPKADRATLDAAFADAMLAVSAAHPDSDAAALLAAEAAMDMRPWDYWQADKSPYPRIGDAVRLVETVLARNPRHPQASHLYIHLMENGPDPKKAEAAADRLATPLAPTAGHLVHMPAHIYYRLGRWKDSLKVNLAAVRADEAYLEASSDQGIYRYGYYPHNVHFIVTSAQMAGEMPTAIRESQKLAGLLDPATSAKIAWIQAIHAAPYFAAAQFAPPPDILAMPPPDPRLGYATAMRHYARAVARAGQGNRPGFDEELRQLRKLRETGDWKSMVDQGVPVTDLLLLAETVARGRFAMANRQFIEAARHYRAAAAIERTLPYMEPPYWYFPVHQSLGAALYRAGQFGEARDAFTIALAQLPNNGWALYGLAASERALGLKAQAARTQAAFRQAWAGDPQWLRMERL